VVENREVLGEREGDEEGVGDGDGEGTWGEGTWGEETRGEGGERIEEGGERWDSQMGETGWEPRGGLGEVEQERGEEGQGERGGDWAERAGEGGTKDVAEHTKSEGGKITRSSAVFSVPPSTSSWS